MSRRAPTAGRSGTGGGTAAPADASGVTPEGAGAVGSGGVTEERVDDPARSLIRLTESKPDGRRLTRYSLAGAPRAGGSGARSSGSGPGGSGPGGSGEADLDGEAHR